MSDNSDATLGWLKERFRAGGLQAVFRQANMQRYREAFDHGEYRMVDYDPLMLDYQIAYMRSAGWVVEDYSVTLLHDGRAAALCPLLVFFKEREVLLSSSTTEVFPPLFIAGVAGSVKKRLTKDWLGVVRQLAKRAGAVDWSSQEAFRNQQGLSDWHHLLMADGAQLAVAHDWYVDLSLDMANIKAGFRTSYKSLINKAGRLWQVKVVSGRGDKALWETFHALHALVSGRQTRSQATWDLQWEAVIQGRGFLVCLLDVASRMVGGGYFHFTPDEAVYAVGAYDRALFDKPLGHAVQHRAIQELKSRGIRWYRIGRQCYATDTPAPSDKECAISSFKSGFATHLFPVFRTLNHASLS